jgi:predicted dehydrogenase
MSEIRLGVVGVGPISVEHIKVVEAICGMRVTGITSRRFNKALEFTKKINSEIRVYETVKDLVSRGRVDGLLILVSCPEMYSVVKECCRFGIPIFLEKPPGLSLRETEDLAKEADKYSVKNMVGFNRRFYSIFRKGVEIIKSHGDIRGVMIEGHERFWKVIPQVDQRLRENWLFANSTHTIDLIRFFGGNVERFFPLSRGRHEKYGDQFQASFEFDSGAIGSYVSHWYSPGGWSVRLFGDGVTVEYKPLEVGKWVDSDFQEHEILPDKQDSEFKPGFFLQMKAYKRLVKEGVLDWPGQDLSQIIKTMELANQLIMARNDRIT